MKVCTVCKESKPLTEYYNSTNSKDGKNYRCKQCDNKARRKYYKENETSKEKRLERSRRHKYKTYGISSEDYNLLIKEQDYKCACCGGKETKSPSQELSIDHDHLTGKIRGLLCNNCNRAIGLLGDDVDGVRNALCYLVKHYAAETH